MDEQPPSVVIQESLGELEQTMQVSFSALVVLLCLPFTPSPQWQDVYNILDKIVRVTGPAK
jgi:hypothetical protein